MPNGYKNQFKLPVMIVVCVLVFFVGIKVGRLMSTQEWVDPPDLPALTEQQQEQFDEMARSRRAKEMERRMQEHDDD